MRQAKPREDLSVVAGLWGAERMWGPVARYGFGKVVDKRQSSVNMGGAPYCLTREPVAHS